ncbi:MAG: regulatory protein RecX [Flavobacteriales bacterium]
MTLSDKELLYKLKLWCDRQERCHSELRTKLYKEGVYGEQVDQFVAELISENYINESRFAAAYVSGKFRIKRWGRNKIIQNLKMKRVSEYCIKIGLKEIDEEAYETTIATLIEKKLRDYRAEKNPYALKSKVAKYIMTRGFEGELVWDKLNKVVKT